MSRYPQELTNRDQVFVQDNELLLYALLEGGDCVGYEALTLDSDAAAFTPTIPAGTRYAIITVEADAACANYNRVVRYLTTGDSPTSTDGAPLAEGETRQIINSTNLANLEFHNVDAGVTNILHLQYFK